MPLTEKQRKHLRALGHGLKPVVMIGQQGLKPTVLEELETALDSHELIKVKVSVGDRDARDQLIQQLCDSSDAELVQRVGNIAVLFRRNPEMSKISLPRA